MERDMYKFRSKARIVAFVDLILSSMFLGLCMIAFLGLAQVSSQAQAEGVPSAEGSNTDNDSGLNLEDLNSKSPFPDFNSKNPRRASELLKDKKFMHFIWILLCLLMIVTGFQVMAAIRLLNATQLGKEPVGALRLARFWKRVCIFCTVMYMFQFLSCFGQRNSNFFESSFMLTSITIRILTLWIVQQYMTELETASNLSLPIHRGVGLGRNIILRRNNEPMPCPPTVALGGENMAYMYDAGAPPQYPGVDPKGQPFDGGLAGSQADMAYPPPKYDDVVKEPFKFDNA